MADLILGSTTAISESGGTVTLANGVQDNITRLGTVTTGTIGSAVSGFHGLQLIKKTVITGNPTTVEFVHGTGDVVIDSTYERYFFSINNVGCSTHDYMNVGCQVGTSAGFFTSALYQSATTDANETGHTDRHNSNFKWFPFGQVGMSNANRERGSSGHMWLNRNNTDGGNYTSAQWNTSYWQDNNRGVNSSGGGAIYSTVTTGDNIDRIRFFITQSYTSADPGTLRAIVNGTIVMYGLKL